VDQFLRILNTFLVYCSKSVFFPQFFGEQYEHLFYSSSKRFGTCLCYDFCSVSFSIFFRLTRSWFINESNFKTFFEIFFLILQTVFLLINNVLGISVSPFCWFTSSMIRFLVISLAFFCPLLTKSWRNFTSFLQV
jgi:hypothetical protein